MIKRKAKVSFSGPMVESTKEAGKTASNTVWALTQVQLAKRNKENGKTVKDCSGSAETQ